MGQPITVHQIMSFLGRPPFVLMDKHNFTSVLCHSQLHIECSPFSCSIIFSFHLLFQCSISSRGCVSCSRVHFPFSFLLLMWLSLPVLCPIFRPFIFSVLGLLFPVVAPGLFLCERCILSWKNLRLLHSYCLK